MTSDIVEKLAIREVIENWALWRDAGTGSVSAASGMMTGG
jgi:hypothetical protein